jgi:hypothetical protein
MPRVLAAFLTGAALSAIVLIIFVIRRDVNGAIVSLRPLENVAGPSLSAAPVRGRGPDEVMVTSPSRAPMIAPSLPAPYVASDSNLRITPSRAPSEIALSATPSVNAVAADSRHQFQFRPGNHAITFAPRRTEGRRPSSTMERSSKMARERLT